MNLKSENKSYFDLTEHNPVQKIVFLVIFISSFIAAFHVILPLIEIIVNEYLEGRVFNAGELVNYALSDNAGGNPDKTGYYRRWAIDIYLNTNQESRYWFSPIIALIFPLSLISLFFGVVITSLLPQNIGFIRQKIEREIAKSIDKVALMKDGFYQDGQIEEITKLVLTANIRDMHDYQKQWKTSYEDLKTLKRALQWKHGSAIYKLFNLTAGINIYMRFYFTEKYSNTMLGLVYIGAAVLIIIIGMRGLKFIPSTQPSFVFFALGLEFSLLLTYALTLMFARQEDDHSDEMPIGANSNVFLSNDFGNSKEVENLLRVFIKNNKDKPPKDE